MDQSKSESGVQPSTIIIIILVLILLRILGYWLYTNYIDEEKKKEGFKYWTAQNNPQVWQNFNSNS